MGVLKMYEQALGRKLIFEKSSVLFRLNASDGQQWELLNIFGVEECHSVEKYLWLLTCVGRKEKGAFNFLKESIQKYVMSIFHIPFTVCQEMKVSINNLF